MSAGEISSTLISVATELERTHLWLIGAEFNATTGAQTWSDATTSTGNESIEHAIRDALSAHTRINSAIELIANTELRVHEYAAIVNPGYTPPKNRSIRAPEGQQLIDDPSDKNPFERALRRATTKVEDLQGNAEKVGNAFDKVVSATTEKPTGPPPSTTSTSASPSAPNSTQPLSSGDVAGNLLVTAVILAQATRVGVQKYRDRRKRRRSGGSQ